MKKPYFTFWLKFAIATILIASLIGCRSVKTKINEQTKTDVVSSQVKSDHSKENILEKINRILENAKSSSFESNLNLIPNANSKVLRYVEIREGKPYREIEIQGGSLQERKTTKDTIYIRDTTSFQRNIQRYRELIDSLQVQINQLQEKELKTEKKASSWRLSGWLVTIILILLALLFIKWRVKLF